jgi:hypothetical protein
MPTTTYKEDYSGRDLVNATPGTSQATDFLGRAVQAGNLDYLGRSLTSKPWPTSGAVTVGTVVYVTGGELTATTAGTTAATVPTAPGAVGGTVVDGSVTWTRTE